jgi:hypothetical protein
MNSSTEQNTIGEVAGYQLIYLQESLKQTITDFFFLEQFTWVELNQTSGFSSMHLCTHILIGVGH